MSMSVSWFASLQVLIDGGNSAAAAEHCTKYMAEKAHMLIDIMKEIVLTLRSALPPPSFRRNA